MVEIDSRKASLIAELEVSRGEMRGALRQCEANLNPVAVLRRSVRNHSAAWLSTAALAGLVLSQLVRLRLSRPSTEGPRGRREDLGATGGLGAGAGRSSGRGWIVSLGRLAFDLFKPALVEWANERLAGLARAEFFTGHPQARNGVRPSVVKKPADGDQSRPQNS
jgi:hypothetical protein